VFKVNHKNKHIVFQFVTH